MSLGIPSIYMIRKNSRMVGFADSDTAYLIGFTQQTHAYLVKRNLVHTPMVRMERVTTTIPRTEEFRFGVDMDAKLSIVKERNDEFEEPVLWKDDKMEVVKMDMDDFVKLPITNGTGIIIPFELMEEDDDSYTFKCQIIDAGVAMDLP